MSLLLLIVASFVSAAETSARPKRKYSEDPADKEACKVNLNKIYAAIQEYQKLHQKLPDKLSNLVPALIDDPNVLICPHVQKTGQLNAWRESIRFVGYTDTRTSYGYEFCAETISPEVWHGVAKTQRDNKESAKRKLGEKFGPMVPILRCFAHGPWGDGPHLNVAFNGTIYESALEWESNFNHEVPEDQLVPAKLFADRTAPRRVVTEDFPPRDPKADSRLLDLSQEYNGLLTDSWQGFPGDNLGNLPTGLREFDGVRFDVRGVIQLRGHGHFHALQFPEKIERIAVNQKANRIHFLHGTAFHVPDWQSEPRTNAIGKYLIHDTNGATREVPLIYGKEVLDWWFEPGDTFEASNAKIAWTGTNEASRSYDRSIRLYRMTWENPGQELSIATISFVSSGNISAPFLVAITVE